MKDTAIIILAAGRGERMKSSLPKVLHQVCGRPMLGYVLDLAQSLKVKKSVIVLGHKYAEVKKYVGSQARVVIQKRLLGTADAVKQALRALSGFSGTILVIYGDIPLLKKDTVNKLLKFHNENDFDASILTAFLDDPAGYGRILRDKYSGISGIAEEKDADDFQKDIKEINTGIICFKKKSLLGAINKIRLNSRKKEYYLTDIIGIFHKEGKLVEGFKVSDANESLGINSRAELARANSIMQKRINDAFMKDGISIVDPSTTFISYGAKIGADSVIYPFTVIESNVRIGNRCSVGPFAHLREGARLEDDVVAGNFLEIVRSKLSKNTWAKHFCYLGDSSVGRNVNIGAGTVIANFDGKKKNFSVIKDNALIGSDTVLVAPVKVGKGSATGAGAVVTKDIPDKAVVVGVPAKPLKRKR